MSRLDQITPEFEELLSAACREDAAPEELLTLERAADDPDSMRLLADYLQLNTDLQWLVTRQCNADKCLSILGMETVGRSSSRHDETEIFEQPPAIPSLSPLPSLSTTHYPLPTAFVGGPVFSYMVATVVLCLMLLWAWAYKISHVNDSRVADNSQRSTTSDPSDRPELVFVGKITGMKECRWSDPDTQTILGASVTLDREYALTSGLLEITYQSGARVILEGPCTYAVDSGVGGYLKLGKLTARVENKGSGVRVQGSEVGGQKSRPSSLIPHPSSLFSVRTPTAVVTDLGTEFGVEVDTNGDTVSYVFQGSISVQGLATSAASGATEKVLHENESIRVSRVRETHQDSSSVEQVRFTHPTTKPKFIRKISPLTREHVYDFSRCKPGNIDGQDGWYVETNLNKYSKENYINIVPNATPPMTDNYAVCVGDDHKYNVVVRRINDQDWSYSIPLDANWEMSALVYVGPPEDGAESVFIINQSIEGNVNAAKSIAIGSRSADGQNVQWVINGDYYFAVIGEAFQGVCKIGLTAKSLGDGRYNIMLWHETTPGDIRTRRHIRSVSNVETDVSAFNMITVITASRSEHQTRLPSLDNLTIQTE